MQSQPERAALRSDMGEPGNRLKGYVFDARFWRYCLYRSYLNLISEASRYRLGWLWWFLEPLAMTAVFYIVFTFIRPRGEDFIYFLIVGVTAWLWFSSGVGNATQSLITAKNLVLQMKVPKLMFPAISAITASFKQVFVFAILLVVVGTVAGPAGSWLALPLLLAVQFLLIVACAVTVAFLCAWLPDVRFVVVSGLQLMMFCSGIFFDIATFPPAAQEWFRLNPMAVLLEQYRLVLLHQTLPDFLWCAAAATVSGAWTIAVGWAYTVCDQQLTRRIIS